MRELKLRSYSEFQEFAGNRMLDCQYQVIQNYWRAVLEKQLIFNPEAVVSLSKLLGRDNNEQHNIDAWLNENCNKQYDIQCDPSNKQIRRILFEDMGDAIRFTWYFENT